MAMPSNESKQSDRGAGEGFSAPDLPRAVGRTLLLRMLARGGMGEVYLASTTGIEGAERPVVVKVIRREHASDPSFFARFLDEARVQSQLTHSGVAQVLDAATDEATGEPYVVIEHVEGRSLGEVRARTVQLGERLEWADAVALVTMIAEALAHVHERTDASGKALSIVHRDLSPQNVMLSYAGDIKLIDFGTARGENRRCHTVAGVVFAKPGYVAPEVANGTPGDARVDLYALGIILWELCKGQRFLQGDAAEHMAKVARDQNSPPPVAAEIGAPLELDGIIAKLCAFQRDDRYAASRVVASDLARLLGAAPALQSGERGIRARAAALMGRLFPTEPARSRREFERLNARAKADRAALLTPASRAPAAIAKEHADEQEGLLPGTRYRLVREIGRGASSVVYQAVHVDLGRRVAIKVLASREVASTAGRARFRREARAMSRLTDPRMVKLLDFGHASDDRPYCVMELLEGETLEAFLAREKSPGWRASLVLAKRAIEALSLAHAAGIVHRDVKPSNLFLTKDGEVKLLDFGLATTLDEAEDEPSEGGSKLSGLTIFGTPEYMAPEQASSGRVDPRADVYAMGCVMYEMLTGRLPFVRKSSVATLDAKIKGSPERLRERAPSLDIPKAVDDLVMRAIARHPSLRFQTAAEMLAPIDRALQAPARSRMWRRTSALAVLAAIMTFGLVLIAGKAQHDGLIAGTWSRVKTAAAEAFGRSASVPAVVAEALPPAAVAPSEPTAVAAVVAEEASLAPLPAIDVLPEEVAQVAVDMELDGLDFDVAPAAEAPKSVKRARPHKSSRRASPMASTSTDKSKGRGKKTKSASKDAAATKTKKSVKSAAAKPSATEAKKEAKAEAKASVAAPQKAPAGTAAAAEPSVVDSSSDAGLPALPAKAEPAAAAAPAAEPAESLAPAKKSDEEARKRKRAKKRVAAVD